jgi:hypothetical protein
MCNRDRTVSIYLIHGLSYKEWVGYADVTGALLEEPISSLLSFNIVVEESSTALGMYNVTGYRFLLFVCYSWLTMFSVMALVGRMFYFVSATVFRQLLEVYNGGKVMEVIKGKKEGGKG